MAVATATALVSGPILEAERRKVLHMINDFGLCGWVSDFAVRKFLAAITNAK